MKPQGPRMIFLMSPKRSLHPTRCQVMCCIQGRGLDRDTEGPLPVQHLE